MSKCQNDLRLCGIAAKSYYISSGVGRKATLVSFLRYCGQPIYRMKNLAAKFLGGCPLWTQPHPTVR